MRTDKNLQSWYAVYMLYLLKPSLSLLFDNGRNKFVTRRDARRAPRRRQEL